MTRLYIDLDREEDKYFIQLFDLKYCIEIGRDYKGNLIIHFNKHNCSIEELVEFQDKITDFFRKRGAIIVKHGRVVDKTRDNEEYIYYSNISIIDTETGNIYRIMVYG